MEIPASPGVYKITIGNRFYYGSTSKSLVLRKKQHIDELIAGRHPNRRMQHSWNKYQELTFEVMETCLAEESRDREQVYLDLYFGDDLCLNMKESAYGGTNVIDLPVDDIARLNQQGVPAREIVEQLGLNCVPYTAMCRIKDHGHTPVLSGAMRKVIPKEDLVDMYVNQKMSLLDIRDATGIPYGVIYRRLIEQGVKMRPVGSRHAITDAEIYDMYHNQNLSTCKIAKLIGMSRSGVSKRLRLLAKTTEPNATSAD